MFRATLGSCHAAAMLAAAAAMLAASAAMLAASAAMLAAAAAMLLLLLPCCCCCCHVAAWTLRLVVWLQMFDGHLIDFETYVGGRVEALKARGICHTPATVPISAWPPGCRMPLKHLPITMAACRDLGASTAAGRSVPRRLANEVQCGCCGVPDATRQPRPRSSLLYRGREWHKPRRHHKL